MPKPYFTELNSGFESHIYRLSFSIKLIPGSSTVQFQIAMLKIYITDVYRNNVNCRCAWLQKKMLSPGVMAKTSTQCISLVETVIRPGFTNSINEKSPGRYPTNLPIKGNRFCKCRITFAKTIAFNTFLRWLPGQANVKKGHKMETVPTARVRIGILSIILPNR
jgi:hypothetical protein